MVDFPLSLVNFLGFVSVGLNKTLPEIPVKTLRLLPHITPINRYKFFGSECFFFFEPKVGRQPTPPDIPSGHYDQGLGKPMGFP